MDYSQFLAMKQEIGLLVVFLLVFLYDTFMPRGAQKGLPVVSSVLMLLLTVAGCLTCCLGQTTDVVAFGGMYETSAVVAAIKNILNIGVVIVLIQSIKWANGEFMIMRRGEFYELLLVTLFGMYLMISARHFLVFVIGLECASLPLAAMVAFDKNRYESHEAAVKCILNSTDNTEGSEVGENVDEDVEHHRCHTEGVVGNHTEHDVAGLGNRGEGEEALHVALADCEKVTDCDGKDNQCVEHPFPNLGVERAEHLSQNHKEGKCSRAFGDYRKVGSDRSGGALINIGGPKVEGNERQLESNTGDHER